MSTNLVGSSGLQEAFRVNRQKLLKTSELSLKNKTPAPASSSAIMSLNFAPGFLIGKRLEPEKPSKDKAKMKKDLEAAKDNNHRRPQP